jgi:hypothetical protein
MPQQEISKPINVIIRAKADFDYGITNGLRYFQILLSFGTFFEVFKLSTGISRIWYLIIIPIGLLLTLLWGRFLRKSKIRTAEAEMIAKENPYLMEIHAKTK